MKHEIILCTSSSNLNERNPMGQPCGIKHFLAAALSFLVLSGLYAPVSAQTEKSPDVHSGMKMPASNEYWPSLLCRGCHDKIFDQHSESMHARSFENPVFQAEYFRDLLPNLSGSGLYDEARACTACHSPVTYINSKKSHIDSNTPVDPQMSGVTCDLCHTISGYKGGSPGNANYISAPGYRKLGPFKHKTDWHHVYSELQTKSEFCAICHSRVNQKGLEIISTFSEWKNSEYAKRGIQCQDCHMTIKGFLTAGHPVYESGKAAHMFPGLSPDREKLYTHRFPGAHSKTQVEGAISLKMEFDKNTVSPGDEVTISLFVDNSRTGHRMPSGSAELRLLLLDLETSVGNKPASVPARPVSDIEMHDVSGRGRFDKDFLGRDMPDNRRIYRAVCVDENGMQTFFSYNAAKIIYDNRLNASEVRKETYTFRIPDIAEGTMEFTADLYYISYPDSFARKLGIHKAEPIRIASAKGTLQITGK